MLLADVAETIDNLRKINMKLNLKKCSFGVEEGKFLGYMVTSEGIHANPKKTRILADLQSPRMLKEMQSLARNLIALNSRTLNEAKRNYAPMEKLALPLVHMTRRLRRYFEAHPVKVITDQPIKQILSKTKASLEKYVVELGAYNITFEPRNVVKGKVLEDFITETPDGESPEKYFWTPKITLERDETEEWMLFTDGASSSKGSRVEYKALLVELKIAKRMNIQKLEAKVDSKLVASQINGNYIASCDNMVKYLAKAKEYIACFKSFSIKNILRNQNQKADVLSKLALVAFNHLTKKVLVEILNERSTEVKEVNTLVEEEGDNWMTSIIQCLKKGIWPTDKNEARNLRVKINQYAMENGGMDILRPLPQALGRVKYVIVEIDYFNKWNKAKPLARITGKDVIRLVLDNIICRFGLPRIIVTGNGTQFVNDPFKNWCTRLSIQQINTTVTHPQANGLVERANKSLMEGIITSLTYGSEAFISTEIGMPTYRTMMNREGLNVEEIRLNLDVKPA
nr:hypothetical protein [Tanacetum cinerariifolium]